MYIKTFKEERNEKYRIRHSERSDRVKKKKVQLQKTFYLDLLSFAEAFQLSQPHVLRLDSLLPFQQTARGLCSAGPGT